MTRNALRLSLALVAVLGAGAAHAQTATDTFDVTATVVKKCKIAATGILIGNYDPLDPAATPGSGTITVTCTKGATYTVALDNGGAAVAGVRAMQEPGGDRLEYKLYSDAALSTEWNATTTVSNPTGGAVGKAGDPHVVYASVLAEQNAKEGSYTDTVTATVQY
jgi:spore coat protein U-like protein